MAGKQKNKINAPDDKYVKMGSCLHYVYVDDFLDYCKFLHDEYPCDAPDDYPLWEECEKCQHWKPKKAKKGNQAMKFIMEYYTKEVNDKPWIEPEKIEFKSYDDFRKWFYENIAIDNHPNEEIYLGRPSGFDMEFNDFSIGKYFDDDVTWYDFKKVLDDMERFFNNDVNKE